MNRRTRNALQAVLGLHLGGLAFAAAVVLAPVCDVFFDPDVRMALYIGALLVLYVAVSAAIAFSRPRATH